MTSIIEVIRYKCRYCDCPVEHRGKHEIKCQKNPANVAKKQYIKKQWPNVEKHPQSINLLKKHVDFIKKVAADSSMKKSVLIRNCIEYVIQHDDLIVQIQQENECLQTTKHALSVNMLGKHSQFINALIEQKQFNSNSDFMRILIDYIMKHGKILEKIIS